MNVLELLEAGRAIIADREKWTQGSYARVQTDSNAPYVGPGLEKGYQCASASPKASCWCSVGVLRKILMEPTYDEDGDLNGYLYKESTGAMLENEAACILSRVVRLATDGEFQSIENFNDSKSHAEVLEAWDAAIAVARG